MNVGFSIRRGTEANMRLPFMDAQKKGEEIPLPWWRWLWKRVGVHAALMFGVVFYIVSGALMFQYVESAQTAEEETQAGVKELLDKIRINLPENITEDLEQQLRDILHKLEHKNGGNMTEIRKRTDEGMYSWSSLPAAILFAFTAVSTIGYGHIYPVTRTGRILCIFYTMCGIPLFMIAVADVGKFLWEGVRWLFRGRLKQNSLGELPLALAMVMLMLFFGVYLIIGALMLPLWENLEFVRAFYFCFISLTTVGFGDIIPENPWLMPVVLLYIFFGLALTTLAIEVLAAAIRRFHYLGYPMRGARLASVWVGGKLMTVEHLLRGIGRELGVSEDEMEEFSKNIDGVVENMATELDKTGQISMSDREKLAAELADFRKKRQLNAQNDISALKRTYSGVYDNLPETWTAAMRYMVYMDQDPRVFLDEWGCQLDNIPLSPEPLL